MEENRDDELKKTRKEMLTAGDILDDIGEACGIYASGANNCNYREDVNEKILNALRWAHDRAEIEYRIAEYKHNSAWQDFFGKVVQK